MEYRVKDFVKLLEEFAPLSFQESWDNSGLIVGSREQIVDKILLALDCTEETVQEAVELGANLIITHHPLIFKGLKRVSDETYVERAIKSLIKNEISLYSIHTNIDRVPQGVSGQMADKLMLENRCPIEREIEPGVGLGLFGTLPQPVEVKDLIVKVKELFGVKALRCSRLLSEPISKIALCGGSGSSLIERARALGAQVFITGDISYHNFFCEEGFMVMDIGHYESEIGVLDLLKEIIIKKIANFAVYKSKNNNNPIFYH